MTIEEFAELAVVLENLPPQYEQRWDETTRRLFFAGLERIPSAHVQAVARAVWTQCSKRPAVADILRIWRSLDIPAMRPPEQRYFEVNYDLGDCQSRVFGAGVRRLGDVLASLDKSLAREVALRRGFRGIVKKEFSNGK